MGKLTQASTLPGPDTEHSVSNTGSPTCPRGGQCLSTWRPELMLQPWGTRAQSLPIACSPAPRSSRLSPGPHPQSRYQSLQRDPTGESRPALGTMVPLLQDASFCSPGLFCPPSAPLWGAPPGPGLQAVCLDRASWLQAPERAQRQAGQGSLRPLKDAPSRLSGLLPPQDLQPPDSCSQRRLASAGLGRAQDPGKGWAEAGQAAAGPPIPMGSENGAGLEGPWRWLGCVPAHR